MKNRLQPRLPPWPRRGCCGWGLALTVMLMGLPGSLLAQGQPTIQSQPKDQDVLAGGSATFAVVATGPGTLTYQWKNSAGPIPNGTNATLKLTGVDLPDAGIYFVTVSNAFGGAASAGAVLRVTRVDFGDAPAPYPTLLSANGARHIIAPGVYLGAGVSFEPDGQPDPNAAADTFDDGVTFITVLARGSDSTVQVVASTQGYLDGWVDFNANGDWGDQGEQVFFSVPLTAGTNLLSLTVPATVPAATGRTFARFRFSTTGGLGPTGLAEDGEVEDYEVRIYSAAADLCAIATISPSSIPPTSHGQGMLTVSNLGPSIASNVVLSNVLSGVNVLSVQADPVMACTVQADTIVCTDAEMGPGEARTIRFDFQPQQPSIITNVMTVRSDTLDPKPANNRAVLVVRAAQPLVITQPPQDVTVLPGGTATFSVTAQGQGTLSYLWLVDGQPSPGATGSTLTLTHVLASAQIQVQVSDSLGSVLSPVAALKMVPAPQIQQQPQPASVPHGGPAQFIVQVDAAGSSFLQYQWRLNGANIPGATNPVYELTAVARADAGSYTVAVASEGGVTVSEAAALTCPNVPIFPASDALGQAPPLNQAGTSQLQGLIQTDNFNATREPGEPNHVGRAGGASVWFQWMAPVDGIATFDTAGSTFDTLLAVYTGSGFSNLVEVAGDDDSAGYFRSQVQFNVKAGQNFLIAIDGFAGREGVIVLAWSVEQTAQLLPTISVHPKSVSVPAGAPFTVSANASSGSPNGQLFYQWLLNARPVPGANNSIFTIPGMSPQFVGTYSVQIASTAGRVVVSRPATLEIGPVPAIQSQDKIESVLFPTTANGAPGPKRAKGSGGPPPFISVAFGIPGAQTMNNTNSTADIDCFRIGTATRWLGVQVTNDPAASGSLLRVDSVGSAVATELAVYRFTAPSCLESVPCMHANIMGCDTNGAGGGGYSLIQFSPLVGGQYLVFADGLSGAQGLINMNWQLGAPPILDVLQSNCTLVVAAGIPVTLNSGITNSPAPAPACQWYYYGAAMAGATNRTLPFTPIQSSDAGIYSVIVSNCFGVVTNTCCVLVNPPLLRYQASVGESPWSLTISAALLPGWVLQSATNLSAPIQWQNLVTNTTTNCSFHYVAPMQDTKGKPLPERYYRARIP